MNLNHFFTYKKKGNNTNSLSFCETWKKTNKNILEMEMPFTNFTFITIAAKFGNAFLQFDYFQIIVQWNQEPKL